MHQFGRPKYGFLHYCNTSANSHSSFQRTASIYHKTKTGSIPYHKESPAGCFHLIREKITAKGLSTVATDIILHSWRKSTGRQYETYFGKWILFSETEQVNPFDPPTETVLAFLSTLYEKNTGYSAINTAKSALSSMCSVVSNRDIDNEKIITRFMRGIFNSQPSLLNYTSTWDVNMVFKYLETLSDNKDLSLLELSQKTAILLMLLSGQRC